MGKEHRRVVGKKQKKKQRNVKNIQRAGASKHGPIASPGNTMSPVPLLLSTGNDSTTLPPQKADATTSCPHVEQAVKLETLRTQFRSKPVPQCASCNGSRASTRAKAGAKEDLWICLTCGQLGCGWHKTDAKDGVDLKPRFLHASRHRHELQHPVVMHWGESFDCWCFECNTPLVYPADEATEAKPRLLQKAAALLQESICGVVKGESDHVESGHHVEQDASKSAIRPLASRRVVKGLMNLGNTCFFNSVMQNLVGVSMLREHFSTEASEPEGVLKTSLRDFFQEMDPTLDEADGDSGRSMRTRSFGGSVGSAVSPRGLFSAICTKAPRFKGFQQQDSHELLRCLLDGLHMEEESLRKTAESNGTEGSPKKVPDTFVEHMFGGQLSSTVTCCECRHSSVVYEAYLDLSLPIPSKQERAKVESIREQLPKSIAQRSQRGNAYGVLSVDTARLDSGLVDNHNAAATEDLKKARDAPPALRCSLGPLSVLDYGAAVNSAEAPNDSEEKQLGSMTGHGFDKLPATTYPCESISVGANACSWGNNKDQGWLDFVDESTLTISGESAAMSFLDQHSDSDTPTASAAAPGSNPPQEAEIGRFSTDQGEEIVDHSPEDMFSLQGGGTEPLDDGNQLEEETIEYGPQLPGADYQAQNKQECLALIPFLPDVIKLPFEVKDQTTPGCPDEISAGDPSTNVITSSGAIAPAEDDGSLDGVTGLFDEESSFSRNDTASEYKPETDANRFSNLDSIGTMPSFSSDVGQISGGRAVSACGVRELETYPIMSLEGCLQAFTKTEVLSGENAWGCENCTRIAHALREPEQSEETVDTKQLPETDGESEPTSVGKSALNAIHDAVDAEGDGVQGEWQSLCLEDHVEDLSISTNSLSIVVVPQARDVSVETSSNGNSMMESSTSEMVDDEQSSGESSAGRAGASLVELSPVEDASVSSKSHNTLKRSQSQDCFNESAALKAAESEPSKEKEDVEEPYVLVEASVDDDAASQNGRSRRNNISRAAKETKERTTKLSSKGLQDGAMKLKRQPPKMVTVKREATKTLLISKAPLVLTVHLKRFAQDMHGRLSKLSGRITFHEQLDLGPFIDQRGGANRGSVYQLIGTVEHSGTMRGGHYVAYVKGFDNNNNNSGETDAESSSGGGSTWYYISDSHVRKTSLESVLQSEAYLLFYERQTFE